MVNKSDNLDKELDMSLLVKYYESEDFQRGLADYYHYQDYIKNKGFNYNDSHSCVRTIKQVYDPITDEIVYQDVKEQKVDFWDRDKGYIFKGKSYFTKCLDTETAYQICDSEKDFAKLMLLVGNLDSNGGNFICVGKGESKRRATLEDISNKLDISIDTTQRFLKRMEEKSLIRKAKRFNQFGEEYYLYVANPNLFIGEKRINDDVYFLFMDCIDKSIPANIKKAFITMRNRKKYGTTN